MGMELPKGGLLGRVYGLIRRVQAMGIPAHAATAGYFIVLSVFPSLVLLLSLLRYTTLDAGDLLDFLSDFLPAALLPRRKSSSSAPMPTPRGPWCRFLLWVPSGRQDGGSTAC